MPRGGDVLRRRRHRAGYGVGAQQLQLVKINHIMVIQRVAYTQRRRRVRCVSRSRWRSLGTMGHDAMLAARKAIEIARVLAGLGDPLELRVRTYFYL